MPHLLEAAILGLVQGLTEFLPVSSSGHLALFQALFQWKDAEANLAFSVAVHLGSLAAVLLFVRREILAMLSATPRLLLVLIVATVPAVAGVFLKKVVEDFSSNLLLVGLMLVGTATILAWAARARDGTEKAATMPLRHALWIGLAQVLAILPGISRSGSTLAAGLRTGLEREQAVRFSFLMAAPAIAGAGFFMVYKGGFGGGGAAVPMLVGGVVSFAASLLALRVMVGVVMRRRLMGFSAYCACAGLLAVALSFRP